MKHFIQNYLLLLLLLFATSLSAQFKGGNGKGNTLAVFANASLGRNIFLGGADDGVSSVAATNLNLGRNIFKGGIDDGNASATAPNLSLGRNIFLGGNDDGFSSTLAASSALGRNIFIGGIDDGNATSTLSNAALGRNVFLGGANDGWAMAFLPNANLALPVTLSNFSAKWQQDDALVTWQTSMELNTAVFELQRSYDGVSFTTIHTQAAAGQSSVLLNYQYTDPHIKALLPASISTVYYRLRTLDIDGKSSYSGIVLLRSDRTNAIAYAIYPNPAREMITVSTNGTTVTNNSFISLYDMSGHLLLKQAMVNTKQQLSVAALAAGTYFLQLSAGGNILYTQKIIIQK